MDILRFPFVLRLFVSCRVSDRNAAERLDCRRKIEIIVELRIQILVRIDSGPDSSKTERFDSQKKVLCRCSAILLPIRILVSSHPQGFTTDYDCCRSLTKHLCVWKYFSHCIQLFPFSDDYKSPWLEIYCRWSSHRCLQDGLDIRLGNWL